MESNSKMFSISSEQFEDICRLCTKTNRKLNNIFVTNTGLDCAMSEAVMECVPINVSLNDGLPALICNQCVTKLSNAYRFRMLCMDSDIILREYKSTIVKASITSDGDSPTQAKKRRVIPKDEVKVEEEVQSESGDGARDDFYLSVKYDDNDPQLAELNKLIENNEETYSDNGETFKPDDIKSESTSEEEDNNEIKKRQRTARNKRKSDRALKKSYNSYKNRKKEVIVEQDGPPCCESCKMTFVSRTNLIRHLSTHTGEKRFSCKVCNKKFATQAYVKSHMVIHTNERKYSCDICGKTFMFNSDLTIHMRKHTGERPYVCETCAKGFVSSSALNAHRFKHGPKRFFCIVCNKGFTYKLELDSHILIHRKDKFIIYDDDTKPSSVNTENNIAAIQETNQQISTPSEVFQDNDQIKTENPSQMLSYVKPEKPPIQISRAGYEQYLNFIDKLKKGPKSQDFVCDVCNKVLSSGSNLYRHKLIHTGLKPHICEMCGKGFKLKADLADHKNRHLGIRTIQCEFCPKMFASRSDYGKHVSTHMDHKPFNCDICSKSYYNVYALNHHKKEHMHPFKCTQAGCLKTYPTEDKLMRHLKIHDETKRRYRCEQCEKVFSTVKSLTRHIRKVHHKEDLVQNVPQFPLVQRSE